MSAIKGGTEGPKINCLAFTDNMVLLSDNRKE